MRTVEIARYGGPEVLQVRTAPDPEPGPRQVLIGVGVVEVLFLDTQLRQGWGEDFFPMRPPWVPGTGVAGSVLEVGEGVDAGWVGTPVVARTGNEGAYAGCVVVDVAEAAPVPDGLDPAVATAALHDGPLALDRLEQAALRPGQRVLITAAAGSVGQWLVPLAKEAGAVVVGAAGGATKTAAVAELGADVVLDYRHDGFQAELAGAGPFDAVFDGVGGEIGRGALARTADGGTFFGYGAASGDFAALDGAESADRGVRVVGLEPMSDETWRRHTRGGLDLLAAGTVRPVIGQRVALERAADAHAAIARREVVGKSVLEVR